MEGSKREHDVAQEILQDKMMQEVLELLLNEPGDADPGKDASSDAEQRTIGPPKELELDCHPLPLTTARKLIRDPTALEHAELKRKIRMKLTSRRFARRRKEQAKTHAATLAALKGKLNDMKAVHQVEQDTTQRFERGAAAAAETQLHRLQYELRVLAEEVQCQGNVLRGLTTATPLGHTEFRVQDAFPRFEPIISNWSMQKQLDTAVDNFRKVTSALSTSMEPHWSVQTQFSLFRGWRISQWIDRGSCFRMYATARIAPVDLRVLSKRIVHNGQHETKRITTNLDPSHFSVTSGSICSPHKTWLAFYTEEVHKFPPPFLPRRVRAINGSDGDDRSFVCVKQSLNRPAHSPPHAGLVDGTELTGVVVSEVVSADGHSTVEVELVVIFDTNAVHHAQQRLFGPELSQTILMNWERHHLD